MANPSHPTEAWQLRPDAAVGVPLGLRLQRAGRRPGLHTAKRPAARGHPYQQQDVGGEESNDVSRFHQLMLKPWVPAAGIVEDLGERDTSSRSARKLALRVLRAVVADLSTLSVIAYA